MTNTPLNPDALEWLTYIEDAIKDAGYNCDCATTPDNVSIDKDWLDYHLRELRKALLAVAQPEVNSMESLPAKMRMLMWEGGEFEVGEIPEGHVLVGFEMATDRAWSMADKATIHIERKESTNGR